MIKSEKGIKESCFPPRRIEKESTNILKSAPNPVANTSTPVALSLGSNLGDREENLRNAIHFLVLRFLEGLKVSSFNEFEPVECKPNAPIYLNAAVTGITRYSAIDLLAACQQIESEMGRPSIRGYHEDRIIDIDVLLYGQLQLQTDILTIPHPEMARRNFVLVPLSEIAPNWTIEPGGKPIKDYLEG